MGPTMPILEHTQIDGGRFGVSIVAHDTYAIIPPSDAGLIAAAPTMIDALRELVIAAEAAGWDLDDLNAPILHAARAALAKGEAR